MNRGLQRGLRAAAFFALGLALTPAMAQGQRLTLFTMNQPTCFGRVYDAAHLARHPAQTVTSLFVYHALQARKSAENWTAQAAADAMQSFKEQGSVNVSAFVTFRDRKGRFHNDLNCRLDDTGRTRCGIDCDGGQFTLERDGTQNVLLRNEGFVLIGGCGEEVEQSETVYFSPGADDKVFRLERAPTAVCRSEQQKATPIKEDIVPLRERFKADETFCLGRDYDAGHLARHPKQRVTRIRLARTDLAGGSDWPWGLRLTASLSLTDGSSRHGDYVCTPLESSFECEPVARDQTGNPRCGNLHIVRAPGDDVIVINRKSALPIEASCAGPTQAQAPHPTRSDDKSFRLTRLPMNACAR